MRKASLAASVARAGRREMREFWKTFNSPGFQAGAWTLFTVLFSAHVIRDTVVGNWGMAAFDGLFLVLSAWNVRRAFRWLDEV